MAAADDFSTLTRLNTSHRLGFAGATERITEEYPADVPPNPRGISVAIPSLGSPPSPSPLTNSLRTAALTPQELEFLPLQCLFDLKTNHSEDTARFKEMITKVDRRELQRMASLLTSYSDYFLKIARNKNGSKRLKILLGKSDDVDTIFAAAILRRFLHVMTDKCASHVAIRGLGVFNNEKKEAIYRYILHYALDIARDQHGVIVLNGIITDADEPYRNVLFDVLAHNALFLSNDAYGNFAIQHVLKLNDFRCKHNVAVNLRGHIVDLSFQIHGSYIVQQLLETVDLMPVVVTELLESEGQRLMSLARNRYGNYVIRKALSVTQKEIVRTDLFWCLVHKLLPFLELLRRSRASNIVSILESIC